MADVEIQNSKVHVAKYKETRRLKSFPWDALVYGSIMAFYLGKWNKTKTKHPLALSRIEPRVTKFDNVPMF